MRGPFETLGAGSEPKEVAPRSGEAEPAAGPRRLLIVDDEPIVARFMAHAAQECGWDAAVAISGAAFRTQYDAEPPDAVLLDLSLPGSDGIELLKFLDGRKAKALILIVSGFDPRVLEAAMRLGRAMGLNMGRCLSKPLLVSELAEALAAAPAAGGGNEDVLCLGC